MIRCFMKFTIRKKLVCMDINNIKMVGIDQSIPIEIREKVSFNRDIADVLQKLKNDGLDEIVILSTCHRSEIYFYSESIGLERIKDFYVEHFKLEDDFKNYLYGISGIKVVEHIFRVACGLESMVVGEDQILGQVKDALNISQISKASGKILNKLFRDAITLGKKVRTDTGIKNFSSSISHIAVKFIQDVFKDIKGKKAFVIGTGEMGKIAIKNLIAKGVNVCVSNRTHSRAQNLKEEIPEIDVVPYEDKYEQIAKSDIVISATNAPHYTVCYDKFKNVYDGKRICMVDIALPRDIDPTIAEIDGVSLYTIDDLRKTAEENRKKRIDVIKYIEKMIFDKKAEFNDWFKTIKIEPYIKKINIYSHNICDIEFERLVNKLEGATERDKENIRISLKRVADKMSNMMISHIKKDVLMNDDISFNEDRREENI